MSKNQMQITTVEISDKDLWIGAKVKNKRSGIVKTIVDDVEQISLAVQQGELDPTTEITFTMFILNKHLFELVDEDSSNH